MTLSLKTVSSFALAVCFVNLVQSRVLAETISVQSNYGCTINYRRNDNSLQLISCQTQNCEQENYINVKSGDSYRMCKGQPTSKVYNDQILCMKLCCRQYRLSENVLKQCTITGFQSFKDFFKELFKVILLAVALIVIVFCFEFCYYSCKQLKNRLLQRKRIAQQEKAQRLKARIQSSSNQEEQRGKNKQEVMIESEEKLNDQFKQRDALNVLSFEIQNENILKE